MAIAIATWAIPLTEDEAKANTEVLGALSDPTRLRILSLLSEHGDTLTVAEIVEHFTLEQPTISHHLRTLLSAKLVEYRKRGLNRYYALRRDMLRSTLACIGA